MRTLASALENHVDGFDRMKDVLQQHQFTLGGNWDYDHGSFDRNLDEANQVWLRIPFQVKAGSIDSEDSSNPDTTVQIGTPFVLKHVYNEGLDSGAEPRIYTALFDQFQEPVDKDASVESHWVEQARQILSQVESSLVV
jgi:hypothetical protein